MASSILCKNIMQDGVILSGGDVDFPFMNAVNSGTAQQARFPSSLSTVVIDLGMNYEYDTIAIAKHNLFSVTGGNGYISVSSSSSNSGPFTNTFTLEPSSNNVSLFTNTTSFTNRYLQIEVGNTESISADIFIGNITVGKKVEISDGQYVGFVSPNLANRYNLKANVTRGGEIAGIIREATPIKTKIQGKHKTKLWFDDNWEEINDCITRYPFYFEWDHNEPPIYCWAKKITPPSWTSYNRMAFAIDIEGFL